MGKIRQLDETTINQIAAGEVIESSASIVKELLENSVDAKASRLYLETKGAGRHLILLSDNGEGIAEEDLLFSVQRHATSKILTAEDLLGITTLGFRGEALASIAAVSKLSIMSSQSGCGSILRVLGGKCEAPKPYARQQGTTIEVRELFYNTPARRAFQRSMSADTAEIRKVLIAFALAHPQVGLVWKHEEHEELELPPGQPLKDRIALLLGSDFASQLIDLGDLGFISHPRAHRPNRLGQYLILNGRHVISPWVSQKVLACYGTRLPTGRFPSFVLTLNLPPHWIDVNVHPQKKEVRLRQEGEIENILKMAMAHVFEKRATPLSIPSFPRQELTFTLDENQISYEIPPPPTQEVCFDLPLRPMGLFSHFLFLEEKDQLQVIDLHRASYRLYFDKMQTPSEGQALLVPKTIEVSEQERLFLMEHMHELLSCGMSMRHFGGHSFLVETIPAWMAVSEIDDFIKGWVDSGGCDVRRLLAKRGRKSKYTLDEALMLWRQCLKLGCETTTPEGKLIVTALKSEALHALFK